MLKFIKIIYIITYICLIISINIKSSYKVKCKKIIDINNLEVVYINLDRRPDRNKIVINELKKSKLLKNSFSKMTGIDGQKLKNTYNIDNFDKKKGWIGCAYSHINLWKRACDENKYYLIFEDDIFIKKGFDEYLKKILNNTPENFDMIYLLTTSYANKKIYNEYFFKLNNKNFLLNAYILSPKGACKLLNKITPYNPQQQIDSWIVKYTNNGYLNNYLVRKSIIWTFQDIDSDVQTNIKKKKYHGKV